jgi:hypothetical protein
VFLKNYFPNASPLLSGDYFPNASPLPSPVT